MTDPVGEIRPIVRVLLLDFGNRLLLLRDLDPVSKVSMWFPVGGGVEPGEDPRQAGTREIAEETGLPGVELGPEVWRRQQHYCWQGKAYHSHERWFLTRVPHYHPCFASMPPDEQGLHHRFAVGGRLPNCTRPPTRSRPPTWPAISRHCSETANPPGPSNSPTRPGVAARDRDRPARAAAASFTALARAAACRAWSEAWTRGGGRYANRPH